jgi:hypothetical protein
MNGRDDDCDGTTDCRDLGCASFCVTDVGVPDRGCMPTPENTNATCADGVDNDCDGFIDCGNRGTLPDFDCTLNAAVTVCPRDAGPPVDTGCVPRGTENTNAACSDRIDNDCDGFIDCGNAGTLPDFDCTRTATVTVCPRDGGTPVDTGCVISGVENTLAECNDRVDNDCDGFIDCGDRNCSCLGACPPSRAGCTCTGAEATMSACRDRVDNDCDGFIDCDDFDCSMNPVITFCARDGG